MKRTTVWSGMSTWTILKIFFWRYFTEDPWRRPRDRVMFCSALWSTGRHSSIRRCTGQIWQP
jgi:hypothetical protein